MSSTILRLISPTCATSIASISRSQLRIRSRTPYSARGPWECYQCRTLALTLARRNEEGKDYAKRSEAENRAEGDAAARKDAKEVTEDEAQGMAEQDLAIPPEEASNHSIDTTKLDHAADDSIASPSSEEHSQTARDGRPSEDVSKEQAVEKAVGVSDLSAEATQTEDSPSAEATPQELGKDAKAEAAMQSGHAQELSPDQPKVRNVEVNERAVDSAIGDSEVAGAIDPSTEVSHTAAPATPGRERSLRTGNVPKHLPSVYDDPNLPTTILSHGDSEARRDLREYARLAAWELPLLHKLAKPFTPPDITKTPLRFRYTSYQGEQHPAARKVVVEFSPYNISALTDAQRLKLIKLAGVRYNPSTRIIKISCESFETVAQNKRYLGDLVNRLVKEAQDPSDMFEDVPVDVRHYKPKARYEFPEEWKIQWKKEDWGEDGEWVAGDKISGSAREQRLRQELQDLHQKEKFVDGRQVIEQLQKQRSLLPAPTGSQRTGERVRVAVGAGGRRKPPGRVR